MNAAQLFLQLGVAGATLFVLYRVVVYLLPQALRPVTVALEHLASATEALRESREVDRDRLARLENQTARIEGKIDAVFDLTPVGGHRIPPQQVEARKVAPGQYQITTRTRPRGDPTR